MKDLMSQMINANGGTKIIRSGRNIFEFIAITFHIRELSKRKLIKLRIKVKNTRSFIVVKVIFDAIPSIKNTIFRLNNRCKKTRTNSAINLCTNNII